MAELRRSASQRAAYAFLQEHARTREAFTLEDLGTAAGWGLVSARTYMSKQLRDYVESLDGAYRTRMSFTRVGIDEFLRQVTQARKVRSPYRRGKYEALVGYEFLLPLTREDRLRRALDDLFYTDTITQRLRDVGLDRMERIIARDPSFSDDQYIELVCSVVSDHFIGYSISHVNGRYRASDLISRAEAGERLAQDRRYLIDETTAIVRFVIKCSSGRSYYNSDMESILASINSEGDFDRREVDEEIRLIRALFFYLFAEAVVETIQGEEEIWLLETGPSQRLYVWERAE